MSWPPPSISGTSDDRNSIMIYGLLHETWDFRKICSVLLVLLSSGFLDGAPFVC